MSLTPPQPDERPVSDVDLNAIGVLNRRRIEARIVAPLVTALAAEFGRDRVHAVARAVIADVAHGQGEELAQASGGCSLQHFLGTLERWTADDALTVDLLEATEDRLSFNVTRCRYAEMYREMGIPELGAILSCQRDAALIEGFNADVTLERSGTLLGGAPHCDFRYTLRRRTSAPAEQRTHDGD